MIYIYIYIHVQTGYIGFATWSCIHTNELQDVVMASSHFLRDGGGCCSAVIAAVGECTTELIDRRVLHGALWTSMYESGRKPKCQIYKSCYCCRTYTLHIVTLYVLNYGRFSDMLSTLLVQVLSTAGIFDLHTRLLGKWHPKWMKQSNPTTTTLFSWRQRREASLSDGRELTTRYWDCIVFMSNIWLGVEEIRSIQLFVRECSNVRPFRTWSLKRETFTKLSPTRSTVPWQPWHRAIWMTLLAGYE